MGEFVRMEEWDLHAVVRGCTGAVEAGESSGNNNNFEPLRVAEESFLFVPSFYPLSPQTILTTSFAVPQEAKNPPNRQKQRSVSIGSEVSQESDDRTDRVTGEVIKTKKSKKYLQKRVVQQMNEADLSSDMWAWRKYGQKPIKASPYPRSYYRCSSSKGCLARKQVERNPLNPEIFIVTFTNEHSHALPTRRNSLAGSTRTKPTVPKSSSVKEESQGPSIISLGSDDMVLHKSAAESESEKLLDRDLSPDMMLRDEFFLGWDTVEGFLTSKKFAFDGCFFD